MKRCFECNSKHMMLVRVSYHDLYERTDGIERKRWICLPCLARRIAGHIDDVSNRR